MKSKNVCLFSIVVTTLLSPFCQANETIFQCVDTFSCRQELSRLLSQSTYTGDAEKSATYSAFSEYLTTLADDITPLLIEILDQPNPELHNIALYSLTIMSTPSTTVTISPDYLPIIEKYIRETQDHFELLTLINDEKVLPVAIDLLFTLKMPVIHPLRPNPKPTPADAIAHFGNRALPFLFSQLSTRPAFNMYTEPSTIVRMFDGADVEEVMVGFAELLQTPSLKQDQLRDIVYLISGFKESALPLAPQLRRLIKDYPLVKNTISYTLAELGEQQGIEEMIRFYSDKNDIYKTYIHRLARHGGKAYNAMEYFISGTENEKVEVRNLAVLGLGVIQNQNALPYLLSFAKAPFDIELNIHALKAIGHLRSNNALKDLKVIANDHWHPAVRHYAREAVGFILHGGESDLPALFHGYISSMRPIHPKMQINYPQICESVNDKKVALSNQNRRSRYADRDVLKSLSYSNAIFDKDKYSLGPRKWNTEPEVGLRLNKGWLTGSDRGEHGGELVFMPDDGEPQIIHEDNIANLFQLGDKIIFISRNLHGLDGRSIIYQMKRFGSDDWLIEQWITLPGNVVTSYLIESGEVLMEVDKGGTFLLDGDGNMQMADCTQAKPVNQ